MDSYIRHFKLYKYVFTSRIVMDVALEFPNEPEEVPTPEPESEKEPIDEALAEAQMPDDELEDIIRYLTTQGKATIYLFIRMRLTNDQNCAGHRAIFFVIYFHMI